MKFCSINICLFFFLKLISILQQSLLIYAVWALSVCLSVWPIYAMIKNVYIVSWTANSYNENNNTQERERETHIDTGSERETGRTRVDTAHIVHRFILCALLKYTTFNEFSINFDWHFSLHTSLGLGRLSDRISPAPNPRRVASLTFSHINGPGCGSVCSWRYVGLGHVKMIDFYTWVFYAKIKRGKRVETPKKTVLKFKHNNSRNDSMRQGVQGLLFHLVSQHQEGMSS